MIAFLQLVHLLFGRSMDIFFLSFTLCLLILFAIIFDYFVFFENFEAGSDQNVQDEKEDIEENEVSRFFHLDVDLEFSS